MNPPTPVAVRAAMKLSEYVELSDEEKRAFLNDPRIESGILRDHIRAVAAEMRSEVAQSNRIALAMLNQSPQRAAWLMENGSNLLRFADRLEGREP